MCVKYPTGRRAKLTKLADSRRGIEISAWLDAGAGGASIKDGTRSGGTSVKVHHLNCGTLRPLAVGDLVCHVLLVESNAGLVLVDTGFGIRDCDDPGRFGHIRRRLIRPVLEHEETAAHQVERLGFDRTDVRHIILTHFDADHIGGLADFPDAQVHATAAEVFGAMRSRLIQNRIRFRPPQLSLIHI